MSELPEQWMIENTCKDSEIRAEATCIRCRTGAGLCRRISVPNKDKVVEHVEEKPEIESLAIK